MCVRARVCACVKSAGYSLQLRKNKEEEQEQKQDQEKSEQKKKNNKKKKNNSNNNKSFVLFQHGVRGKYVHKASRQSYVWDSGRSIE